MNAAAELGPQQPGSWGGTGAPCLGRDGGGVLIRVVSQFGNQRSQASLDKEDLVAKMILENLTRSVNQQ